MKPRHKSRRDVAWRGVARRGIAQLAWDRELDPPFLNEQLKELAIVDRDGDEGNVAELLKELTPLVRGRAAKKDEEGAGEGE